MDVPPRVVVDVRGRRRVRLRPGRQPHVGAVRRGRGRARGRHRGGVRVGLAAISAVIESLPAGATVVLPAGAYTGTRRLLGRPADAWTCRRRASSTSPTRPRHSTATDGAALLWLESPSNPLLEIADVEALAGRRQGTRRARGHGQHVLDAVAAAPARHGRHVVVHSATKLLSRALRRGDGRGRGTRRGAGAVAAQPAQPARRHPGPGRDVPRPARPAHAAGAARAGPGHRGRAGRAAWRGHPKVEKVRYPGFATVVSFDVAGGAPAADAVCAAVRLIVPRHQPGRRRDAGRAARQGGGRGAPRRPASSA